MATTVRAQITDAFRMVHQRVEALHIANAQDLHAGLTLPVAKGGRMRVYTGFLRASLRTSTAAMPKVDPLARPVDGETYPDLEVDFVVSGLTSDKALFLGFTAAYASPREYKDGFVERMRLEWPRLVGENVAKARAAFPDP